MSILRHPLPVLALLFAAQPALPQQPPVGERAPVLRLEAGGATARVTGLAFSRDGKTLYVAGLDKVVRVWTRDVKDQRFEPSSAYRVPIGPGVQGALNALALSPDGKWLATAGSGAVRMAAGFREPGLVWVPSREALSAEMKQDLGTIYVFNTRDGTVHRLPGHGGAVWALSFAHGSNTPRLVSAAWVWDSDKQCYRGELRLWDLDAMKAVAVAPSESLPAPQVAIPVGLSGWSVGNKPNQTIVVMAGGDGRLLKWDVASGEVTETKDGQGNTALAYLADRNQVLSTSLAPARGAWHARFRLSGGDSPQESTFGAGSSLYWPLALAPVWSRSGKSIEYVAAVCMVGRRANGGDQREYRLCLFDPNANRVVHEQMLWEGGEAVQPVLAVGPQGRHLAVAGSAGHAVQVYALGELIGKKAQPARQDLRSVGLTVRHIAWVSRQGQPGLLLRQADIPINADSRPGRAKNDLVFDLAKEPRLADAAGAWRTGADPRPYDAELDRWTERHKIKRQRVTAAALLEAGPLLKERRLLAVGYEDNGEPGLGLYDADTGDQVRELTGHLAAVRSLAFSADGKRLASVSDDQTVAVWDLADLPALLGRRGTLRGVIVVDRANQKGLSVTRVDDNSSAKNSLEKGDVIVGLVQKDKVQRFESARDFYVALAEHKPGETVSLRLEGGRDAKIALEPVIDERKPLFNLFVTRDHDWIGWSPMGPYESSGLKAEGYVGWHIGTDKPERPTAFAVAKEYHKEYYKPGALRELLETGKVAPPKPPAPPKPRMTLWIGEGDGALPNKDAQDRFVLRRRTAVLRLQVEEFPLDQVESVEWQLDDGDPEKFASSRGLDWSAALTKRLSWTRAPHVVRAVLRTRGEDQQQFPVEIRFRYEPDPPQLQLLSAGGKKPAQDGRLIHMESKEADFDLRFQVGPGDAEEKVAVKLTHTLKGKESGEPRTWVVDKSRTLDNRLKLGRGLNTVEIVAVHEGATPGSMAENARILLQVEFEPEPVRVILKEIQPLPAGSGPRVEVKAGEIVTIHAARARLTGMVETKGNAKAEWRRGDEKSRPLKLGEGNNFEVDLEMKPGDQEFTLTASTTGAETDSATAKVRFAPVPPTVALLDPEPVYEGDHTGEVTVRGTLRLPADSAGHTYEKIVRLNGKVDKNASMEVDEKERTVAVRIALEPGRSHRVDVELRNQWGQTTQSNTVLAQYLSPPTKIEFEAAPQAVKKALLNLRATVRSRLPLKRAEATVQGDEGESYPIRDVQWERGKAENTWDISLRNVPLTKGTNTVRLWASNEDGKSRKAGESQIVYQEPADPPVVKLLGPAKEEVRTREYELKFHIRSKAPLQLVEVVHGKGTYPTGQNLGKLPKNEDGSYELKDAIKVRLQSGMNKLEIVAVNEGGSGRALAEINLVVVPVRLEVDGLFTPDGKPVALDRQSDGESIVPLAPQARLSLRGRIVWDDPSDPMLKAADQWVRVYVNGFQQRPGELQPPSSNQPERPFETEILLNRAEGNRIEFELPGLKRNAESRPHIKVQECKAFQLHQWLHLLIIGAGESSETALEQAVLKAIGARGPKDRLQTDVFERVKLYGPLTSAMDNLTPEAVQMQLIIIQESMRGRGEAGASDIVMIYFKGGEVIDKKGHFLLTGERTGQRGRAGEAMASADLARFFAGSRGAQLLFLDVVREEEKEHGPDQFQQWQDDPRVARVSVFRYGWGNAEQRPAANASARLDKVLQEEMPQTVRLGEVEQRLSSKYQKLSGLLPKSVDRFPYFYVYPQLEEVVVNQTRSR